MKTAWRSASAVRLCAAACPADAIWVEAAENTDEERYSPGERYAKTYEINMLRCIFCGYCEDACPTEAIQLRSRTSDVIHRPARCHLCEGHADRSAAGRRAEDTPQQVKPGAFDRSIPDMEDPSYERHSNGEPPCGYCKLNCEFHLC